MSTPAHKAATQQDDTLDDVVADTTTDEVIETEHEDDSVNDEVKALEATVNDAVSKITRDKDGKYLLPKGLSPEVRLAVIAEKRRRDTQSTFTKEQQAKKALEAENTALKNRVSASAKLELTSEQQDELEDLKFSDPDEWRKKMNAYERDSSAKQKKALDDELGQVSADILAKDELERRKDVLVAFNEAHPDFELNDDVIAHDIPPRITKRLETGEISFEAFLQECYDYTKTGKVVKQEKVAKQPNLGKVGGGQRPDKNAEKEDIITSYNKETY